MSLLNGTSLEDSPMWTVYYSTFDEQCVSIAIRCRYKLFYIEILADDLGNWSRKQEILQLLHLASSDDNDAEESLYDLIWEQFVPLISTYAPPISNDSSLVSLQKFYGSEILLFKLVGDGDDIKVTPCPYDLTKIANLRPQINLGEIPDGSKVFHLDASHTTIKPRYSQDSDIASDTPAIVSLDDTPIHYHFKAVQGHSSFLREFRILLQLAENRLNKKYRLPTIHSLVFYSDMPDTVMGMLLHHIDSDGNMADWIDRRSTPRGLREKWYHQIRDTVRALHRHGIVWGDVKPDNVLIDCDRNAWVIDFDGGFSSGYVDKDVMETTEGDEQGVSRMGEELLNGKQYSLPSVGSHL